MTDDTSAPYAGLYPALWLAPAIVCLVALVPLPYGFYTLLRVSVFGTAVLIAYRGFTGGDRSFWPWLFTGLAILFNPVVPIHLTRSAWVPIDVATSGAYLVHWWRVHHTANHGL